MKRKVHPLTGILLVAIILVLIALKYASQERQSNALAPGAVTQPVKIVTGTGNEPPFVDPGMGAACRVRPGTGPEAGIRVTEFIDDPVPSRLKLAGVMLGDSLLGVEGNEKRRVVGINQSLDELITKHKPFTLILVRGGQKIKLPVKSLGKKKVLTTEEIIKLAGESGGAGRMGAPGPAG